MSERDTPPIRYSFDLQGHRGARGLYPENTIPAFRKALELGVCTLEMDIVISQDEQVVVSHDPWFNPVLTTLPDGSHPDPESFFEYKLFEMSFEKITSFDVGLRPHPGFPDQKKIPATKPALSDVITLAEEYVASSGRSNISYNIETKTRPEGDNIFHPEPGRVVELLLDVIESHGISSRTTIQSFDPRTLRQARRIGTTCRLSLLVELEDGNDLESQTNALGFVPEIYSPHYQLVTQEVVEKAHSMGMTILPWTVNDKAVMKRLLDYGIDGLITDYPDIGIELLDVC